MNRWLGLLEEEGSRSAAGVISILVWVHLYLSQSQVYLRYQIPSSTNDHRESCNNPKNILRQAAGMHGSRRQKLAWCAEALEQLWIRS